MPRLAIVIPAVGSIESLENTLVSVLENRPDHSEVLVVLNQPYEDPYELAGEVRFVEAEASEGFIGCANRGIKESRSPIVHLLAGGCEVSPGWTEPVLGHFGDRDVASVAPLVFDTGSRERLLAAGLRYGAGGVRRLVRGKPARLAMRGAAPVFGACSWGGFYRAAALAEIGGFPTQLGDTLADTDLAWSLRHAGYRAVLEPRSHVFAPAEMARRERGFRAALVRERMFWRNAPAVGWVPSLACHPWTIAAELVRSIGRPAMITQLMGRAWGALEIARHRRHHAWLASLGGTSVVLPLDADPARRVA